MKLRHYLYSKLAEEAGELAQIAIKTSLFGESSTDPRETTGETNLEKLEKELTDIIAVVALLNEQLDLEYDLDEKHLDLKKISVLKMYYDFVKDSE